MLCPHDDEIERWIRGELKGTVARTLRDHVAQCSRCQCRRDDIEANNKLIVEVREAFPGGLLLSADGKATASSREGIAPFVSGIMRDVVPVDIPPGYIINGQYEVIEEIGRGLAVVYRALYMGHNIALKVVSACPNAEVDPVAQLAQEWKRQDNIVSEHVARAYLPVRGDYEGVPLVMLPMEYASAGNFRSWLNDHLATKEERLSSGLDLFLHTCHGVAAIHKTGQVHLDLKPENILLFRAGDMMVAKVSDFGIARSLRYVSGQEKSPFACCGTPEYMAPELIDTLKAQHAGVQSDVYSLGVILFELVMGFRPFDGNLLELRDCHLNREPPRLTGELSLWGRIIDRCMRKNPQDRYRSVEDVIRDVNHVKREFSLAVDVACPHCDHFNVDPRKTACESCGEPLPETYFRPCTRGRCNVRVDQEDCPYCGQPGIAAHYLLEERMARAETLKDEVPLEAIELLELILREGAGPHEERAVEILVDLREKHERMLPMYAGAAQASADGDIEEALKIWQDILGIIPRHHQALRQAKHLKEQLIRVTANRDKASLLMDAALFDAADAILVECLELVPKRRDIRKALDQCRTRAREYSDAFAMAEEAWKGRTIGQAMEAVERAMSCARESQEARALHGDIVSVRHATARMLEQAQESLRSAEFTNVHEVLKDIEQQHADCEMLSPLGRDLEGTECRYAHAMKEAEEAVNRHELNEAMCSLDNAIEICPDATGPKRLRDKVREDRRCTEKILEEVPALIKAANFEEADALLLQAAKIWRSHPDWESRQEMLATARDRYDALMATARTAIETRNLRGAAQKLRQALDVCASSTEAASLLQKVEENKKRATELLRESVSAVAEARFKDAADFLDRAGDLWPSAPGLKKRRSAAEDAQAEYEDCLHRAQKARSECDLERALHAARSALSTCPNSNEMHEFIGNVELVCQRTRDHLHQAEACLLSADFTMAEKMLHEARGWWPNLADIEQLTSRMQKMAEEYSCAVDAANKCFASKKFERALLECSRASDLCPESDVYQLRDRIVAEQRRIAARNEHINKVVSDGLRMSWDCTCWLGGAVCKAVYELLLCLCRCILMILRVVICKGIPGLLWWLRDHGVLILKVVVCVAIVAAVGFGAWWVFSDVNRLTWAGGVVALWVLLIAENVSVRRG